MRHFLLRLLVNALALYAAVWFVPGLSHDGGPARFLLVALLFGVVNSLLRPLLTILTCPLVVATLGLFTLVINALLLMVTGWLSERWDLGFSVSGFMPAFLGGIVMAVTSIAVALFIREDRG